MMCVCVYIYICIFQFAARTRTHSLFSSPPISSGGGGAAHRVWLRTNGVNTNWVSAKGLFFDGFEHVLTMHFWDMTEFWDATKPKSKKQQPCQCLGLSPGLRRLATTQANNTKNTNTQSIHKQYSIHAEINKHTETIHKHTHKTKHKNTNQNNQYQQHTTLDCLPVSKDTLATTQTNARTYILYGYVFGPACRSKTHTLPTICNNTNQHSDFYNYVYFLYGHNITQTNTIQNTQRSGAGASPVSSSWALYSL